MAITDESENLLDHLTERVNTNGWRVISNPTRQLDRPADELKTLIQTMRKQQGSIDKRQSEEIDPPEAA